MKVYDMINFHDHNINEELPTYNSDEFVTKIKENKK